jgi:hypothetical protein
MREGSRGGAKKKKAQENRAFIRSGQQRGTRLQKWLGKKVQRNDHECTVRVHPASPAHRGRDLRRFSPAQRHYGAGR